jgi:uncharacterized membrane protein YcgQ (UPF0703/DUF1980 family)
MKGTRTAKGMAVFSVLFVLSAASCVNRAAPPDAVTTGNAAAQHVILPEAAISAVNQNRAAAVVEIKEKMFIAQANDVYLNAEDYLGKTIRLEGLFKTEVYDGVPRCFVLRYGPGCCGYDGNAGFEVAWDGELSSDRPYPLLDDWVKAEGQLKYYEEDGYPYLYIALSSLDILEERGAEFVTQ